MKLEKQCEILGIEFLDIKISYSGNPENATLDFLAPLGYIGTADEGLSCLTVIKAAMLDKLIEHNPFNDKSDACSRYLEAQLTIHRDIIPEIIDSIKNITFKRFIKNLRDILADPYIKSNHPEISYEVCEHLFKSINRDTLISLTLKIATNPYKFRKGWPDITLFNNKTVRFVEVKTSDSLTESQMITIPMIKEILPFEITVIRLIA